jgi:hypothetical protein
MLKCNTIKLKKGLIALLLVGATEISMGSFTGSTDESSKNRYSLTNFNRNFYKNAVPLSLRAGFQFKGAQMLSLQKEDNTISYNTLIRFEKGNTTYIYPYKHKVSIPKFKAPAPPTNR